jgi:CheY-like chemotaxis protein
MPGKILIVDDDYVALQSVAQFLTDEGYQIERASTGLQALKLLENDRFDLVISDISMPGATGYQVLDYVRTKLISTQITQIILMTGHPTLEHPGALTGRADAYFLKPINLKDLLHTIKGMLEKHPATPNLDIVAARVSPLQKGSKS